LVWFCQEVAAENFLNFVVPRTSGGGSKQAKEIKRCSVAQNSPAIPSENLLQALSQCGTQLDMWISESQANAWLFRESPVLAMHAAALDLDMDVMLELEAVLTGLARKLDLPLPPQHPETAVA
jgi:hypothetical protein